MKEIGSTAVEAITPDGVVEYRTPIYLCEICGAAIADTALHTATHEPA